MGTAAALSVGVAAGLDTFVGEPPNRVHPVAYLGRLVGRFDREWTRPRLAGVFAVVTLPILAGIAAGLVVALAVRGGWFAGGIVAGLVLSVTTSLRMLVTTAGSVIEASETDPERALEAVPALVGRDPEALSPGQLRSAAVESAAENLADGLIAPLLAFVVGAQVSLTVGAGAAAWVKAVNTLDSMLGYRSKPVGWASARLDDLVMAVPARLAAIGLAFAARRPGAVGSARFWAGAPPSPNSGWPMATLAAALDVRLVKPGVYDLNPDRELPDVDAGQRALGIVTGAGALSVLVGGVIVWW